MRLRIAVLLSAVTFHACAWGATTMTFPIKEIDFPVEDSRPLWLDNFHLLFTGYSPAEGPPKGLTHRYYIWDINRQTLSREARFDEASRICAFNDYLTYTVQAQDGKGRKRHAFFKGQPVEVPQNEGIWFNPISCRPCATQPPPWVVNGHTTTSKIPLLEDDGYIDRGIDGKDRIEDFPLLYYRSGTTKPIPLGLGSRYTEPHVSYAPFLDAYVLEGSLAPATAHPFWLLHPNGTVEQIFTPEGKEWAKLSWPWQIMTKRGPVFSSLHPRGPHSKDASLYLWSEGTLTRVAEGFFNGGSVSPDGCRLAVIQWRPENTLRVDEKYRLVIIQLCDGGSNAN